MVLAMAPASTAVGVEFEAVLTRRTRMLVRLAALLALDASTASLRWAAELAACAGADDADIVGVLIAVAPDVGAAQIVSIAPRLALAIGYEIDLDDWDGS